MNRSETDRRLEFVVTSMPPTKSEGPPWAAGVEKESQEVHLRNLGKSLPTAVQLIAKINIHYCNYFLRRGCAESYNPRPRVRDEEGINGRIRMRRRRTPGEREGCTNHEQSLSNCVGVCACTRADTCTYRYICIYTCVYP